MFLFDWRENVCLIEIAIGRRFQEDRKWKTRRYMHITPRDQMLNSLDDVFAARCFLSRMANEANQLHTTFPLNGKSIFKGKFQWMEGEQKSYPCSWMDGIENSVLGPISWRHNICSQGSIGQKLISNNASGKFDLCVEWCPAHLPALLINRSAMRNHPSTPYLCKHIFSILCVLWLRDWVFRYLNEVI